MGAHAAEQEVEEDHGTPASMVVVDQSVGIPFSEKNPPPLPAMKQAHKQYPDPGGVALILQI